ncbi:unnamed protein product [Calicophoron daubneyi]|uniref:Tubulin--tyrosine ligase-like protein 5 n=1 Tax=Calicophoron daubneyi TaxID=300641 RepID=A0AAV2TSB7_CALDB
MSIKFGKGHQRLQENYNDRDECSDGSGGVCNESAATSETGSGNESVESLASISDSSFVIQDTIYEEIFNSKGHQFEEDYGENEIQKKKRGRGYIKSGSFFGLSEQKFNWVLPLFCIPSNQSGIMWTGNLRRTPVFIFSQKSMVRKSEAAENLGRLFNMSFRLVRTECRLLRSLLQSHGFQESTSQVGRFNIFWTGCHLKPCQLRLLTDFHKVNHFPRSYEITRKDRLAKNIQRMQRFKGMRHFDFVPQSFLLPDEFREFCSAYLQDKGPYIVKPIASSRGRGIYIISHPEEIPFDEPVIVSRYISNPLLLDGFKFDIRLYVAVTSYEPLVVYLYEEGLVRCATVRYQHGIRHLRTQCMHLTNYSVNKKNYEFVQNDDANIEDFGNKWSLGALLRHLKMEGHDVAGLMMRIEDIVVKSFLCVVNPIAAACDMFQGCKSRCFELYGFDIIVDEDFRPWLLEVNLSPSLACDSPLDFKIKSHMLTDLFNLVGVICHDPSRKTQGGMNRLQVRGDGQQAIPPKWPTYFEPADELMNSHRHDTPNAKFNEKSGSYPTPTAKETFSAHQTGCIPGTMVSKYIPHGLSLEEARLMRRLQEEASRAGGWIRLLPDPEAWEHYSSVWPNDPRPSYFAGEHRSNNYMYSATVSAAIASASNMESTRGDKRLDMGCSLASAYAAAFAISILYEINLKTEPESSSNVEDDENGEASERAEEGNSRALSNETHLDLSPKSKTSNAVSWYSRHKITTLHPNSSPIAVDMVSYLQSRSLGTSEDNPPVLIKRFTHIPNSTAVGKSRIPLHSITEVQMRQYITCPAKHFCDSYLSPEHCKHVSACYMHALSHMPFYLRKLGEKPVRVPGVCLAPQCKHYNYNQSTICGIIRTKQNSSKSDPAPKLSVLERLAEGSDKAESQDNSPKLEQSIRYNRSDPINSSSSLRQRSRLTFISSPTQENKRELFTEKQIHRLSGSQARHVFTAYLSRIQTRLLTESKNIVPDQNKNKAAARKESKEVDLMVRFLRRASGYLSAEAVSTICGKFNTFEPNSTGDVKSLFRVNVPDSAHPLADRKRVLARLLDKFIQIYQYETVAVFPSRQPKKDVSTNPIETQQFWSFINDATEKELESVLSVYTRIHQSVDVFMGFRNESSVPKSTDRTEKENDNEIGKGRQLLCEPMPPISSSDSGFVSATDAPPKSLHSHIDEGIANSHYAVNVDEKEAPASSKSSSGSESPALRLSAWSSCCPVSRQHSPTSDQDSEAEDRKSPVYTITNCSPEPPAEICPPLLQKTKLKGRSAARGKYNNNKVTKKPSRVEPNTTLSNQSKPSRESRIKKDAGKQSNHKNRAESTSLARPPTVLTNDSSSQTIGGKISGPTTRRSQKRRSRAQNPTKRKNQPLLYSTRLDSSCSGPRTCSRGSFRRPRSAFRAPQMVPLCRFSGASKPWEMSNFNNAVIDERNPNNHHGKPLMDTELSPIQFCDPCEKITATSSKEYTKAPDVSYPGSYPPLCTPFAMLSEPDCHQSTLRPHSTLNFNPEDYSCAIPDDNLVDSSSCIDLGGQKLSSPSRCHPNLIHPLRDSYFRNALSAV